MTDTASVPAVSSTRAYRGHPWFDGRVRALPLLATLADSPAPPAVPRLEPTARHPTRQTLPTAGPTTRRTIRSMLATAVPAVGRAVRSMLPSAEPTLRRATRQTLPDAGPATSQPTRSMPPTAEPTTGRAARSMPPTAGPTTGRAARSMLPSAEPTTRQAMRSMPPTAGPSDGRATRSMLPSGEPTSRRAMRSMPPTAGPSVSRAMRSMLPSAEPTTRQTTRSMLPSAEPTTRPSRLPRLSGRPAIFLLASLIVALLASSSAPTPLYAIYQARWGFSPITTTVVFGVYALAVLAALLTLGKLSDHLGRRPILLAALVAQAAALLVFATADGVPMLLTARVIQGLSTGAALGAIGAGMLDIDKERGTFANSVSPGMGTGTGALVSAILVRYLPAPTHLIYYVLLGVFALQALGVIAMRETVTPKPGALATLVPEIKLPRQLRGSVLVAAPVLFAVWALASLYGALGPALVRELTGSSEAILGSASLTALAAPAVIAIIVLRRAEARTVMLTGLLSLITGVAITLLALDIRSIALFFIGTVISGIGFGSGFQGGIRTVVPQAEPHERSGVLSLLYTVSYLGLGLPAVIAGFLVVHGGGLVTTAYEFGAAVIVLAIPALVELLRPHRSSDLH